MTTAEEIDRDELRRLLTYCCATDCQRRSDVVAAFRMPHPDRGRPVVAIASFCRHDYDPTDGPSYAELMQAADRNPSVELYRTLLDRWPHPIPLQH